MSPAPFLVARVFGHSTMVVTPAGRTYNCTMDLSGLVFSMLVIVVYHTVLEGLFGRTVGKLVTSSSSTTTGRPSISARRS